MQYHKRHPEADVELMSQLTDEYLQDPDFAPKAVRKASVACEGLCKWSHAIVVFYEAKEAMRDQEEALAASRVLLDEAKNKLSSLHASVKKLEKGLKSVEKKLERAMREKDELQQETSALAKRINMSMELTRTLAQEKVKWSEMIVDIENQENMRLGDSMLGAALLSFCGDMIDRKSTRLNSITL